MNAMRPLRTHHSTFSLFERGDLAFRVWGITAGALLIIGSYLAWTSYDEYGKTLEQEYRSLETHARFGGAQVAGSLRSIDLLLQEVIDDKLSAPDLRTDVVQRRQLDKLRQFPEIHYLITTDNKGQVATAESLDDPTGVIDVRKFNASQRDYFTVHRDAKPEEYYRYQLSRPFKTITNRNTITFSRAIRGRNGQFQGVVLVSLSPAYFDSVLRHVLVNEGADAAAVHNRFGDIIYRLPDPEKYVGKNIAGGPAFKSYLGSNQQLIRYFGVTVTDGIKRMLVFSKVGDTGLDVGVSAQFDVVMAGWRSNLLMKGLIFVVISGLSLALAFGSQRRLLERRRSEEALQASEERWRFAIEGAGDGLWDWDVPQSKVFFSRRWSEMLGFAQDEIGSGLDEWSKRVHPDDLTQTMADVQAHLDGTTPLYVNEHRVRCKDGSYKWILDRGLVVERDAASKPLRVIGTHSDVTERKQTVEVLAESENRFRLLANALPQLVWTAQPDGYIDYCNQNWLSFTGLTLEETQGVGCWMKVLHPDDVEQTGKLWAQASQRGDVYEVEQRLRSSTDEYRWFLTRAVPVKDAEGNILKWYGSNTDITERKQAEAELLRYRNHLEELIATRTSELEQSRDAAEAGNRAKTIFLANMSHELRTPMNGVMGMIDLVLMRATDPKQIDWLNKSKGAAQSMVSVVNDIIDFSKIEADRLPLEEKNFSLSKMIDDALAMHDLAAEAKGLNLTREVPATFPDQLSGDAFRLRQILLNFLGNAFKFSDQGTITVRVSAVEQDGESVLARIEVEDQGIGISPEQQAMLFQAFTQVDGSMTRKHGGSGLGLVISKRLANLMGGDAGVVSQEGRGSTFWATVRLKLIKASEVGT
jgi:PAS domain S-box-containing protein